MSPSFLQYLKSSWSRSKELGSLSDKATNPWSLISPQHPKLSVKLCNEFTSNSFSAIALTPSLVIWLQNSKCSKRVCSSAGILSKRSETPWSLTLSQPSILSCRVCSAGGMWWPSASIPTSPSLSKYCKSNFKDSNVLGNLELKLVKPLSVMLPRAPVKRRQSITKVGGNRAAISWIPSSLMSPHIQKSRCNLCNACGMCALKASTPASPIFSLAAKSSSNVTKLS
mmetsp:Transcript_12459/g.20445  ORF Transcript_12459/g.20445 Transcript_12459/m.20445 type:complete len:226 (+) Transcript_12459:647-1324(+)